eukprot:973459-Amphidinium_carterae.1
MEHNRLLTIELVNSNPPSGGPLRLQIPESFHLLLFQYQGQCCEAQVGLRSERGRLPASDVPAFANRFGTCTNGEVRGGSEFDKPC